VRRSSSTRFGLLAALAALAALVVSPIADTANFTISPDGPPVVVTVNTAGGTSTATFTTSLPNQRVSLNITNVTITSSKVSLQRSNGTNVVTPFTVTRTGFFMDVVTFPTVGTYKFVVDPKSTYTGQMKLTLYSVPADPTSPITAGGAAVPATTTRPGQNALFTFNGLANHKMSVQVTNVALNGNAKLRILKPDGTALGPAATFGNGGGFLEPQTLTADGPYKVQVDPRLLAVGSFSVQLFDVPVDASVPLTVNGAAAAATTTIPGQNAAFTFAATAGTKYSVKLTESSFTSAKVSWLKPPDNTALFSPALAISPDPLVTFLTPRTLTPAGTYKIFVNPALAETGSVKAQVFTVPPDLSGPISLNTPLHVAISAPGQNAAYTFTGTINHRMSLHLTNNSYDSVKVSILKPDGTALFTPAYTLLASEGFRDPVKLPATGTYKVKVDPVDAATGALDVALYDVTADVSAPIATTGTATPITVNSPGQNAKLTFTTSTSNQRVAFRVSKGVVAGLKASLDKTGTTTHYFNSTSINSDPQFLDTKSLGPAGAYEIVLDPQSASTGTITVTLWLVPPDITLPALTPGSRTVSLAVGQNARLPFTGLAGKTATATFTSGTITLASVKFYTPAGTQLESTVWDPSLSSNTPLTDVLPTTAPPGSYTFLLDPIGDRSGSMTFDFAIS
jgi:hypothetical protein